MEEQTHELPDMLPPIKRKRGRPKGSKTKTRQDGLTSGAGRLVPPTASRHDDFAHADPETMVSRQLSMLSWQQAALRNKIMGANGRLHGADSAAIAKDLRSGGRTTVPEDTKELLDLTNALARGIRTLADVKDLAKELGKQMTAEQLLEAAIAKIEGQALPTINYAIKRLRAKREQLAPVLGLERQAIGHAVEDQKATDAIADLLKDDPQ